MFYTVNLAQDSSSDHPYLSNTLIQKIEENIKNKKKIILYLNKRWAHSSLVCDDCHHLSNCERCDLSLNVHYNPLKLRCHFCGFEKSFPTACESCNSKNLRKVWTGTQQVEESLIKLFPDYTIFRFDADSVKNKTEKEKALTTLRNADIIIGTKMITTGFDFQNVGLIGVILLEQELSIPKYDIEERVYSNINQLIGRWERNGEETETIIQTFIPGNENIKNIIESNYKDFFLETLKERKVFSYPPFSEMVTIEYRDKNKDKAENFIKMIENKLKIEDTENQYDIILVPTPMRRYNQYHYRMILKWKNIREFLKNIKYEIMRNGNLIVIFE